MPPSFCTGKGYKSWFPFTVLYATYCIVRASWSPVCLFSWMKSYSLFCCVQEQFCASIILIGFFCTFSSSFGYEGTKTVCSFQGGVNFGFLQWYNDVLCLCSFAKTSKNLICLFGHYWTLHWWCHGTIYFNPKVLLLSRSDWIRINPNSLYK